MARSTFDQAHIWVDRADQLDPQLQSRGEIDRSFAAILARMTPAERLSACRHGAFTRRERAIWAARFPEEVPMLNGEFEWIALRLADLD